MLSINLLKNNMNYNTLRIIVTGLLFGFSITDASAPSCKKIGQNSFTINPKAVLELEVPPRVSTSSNECFQSYKGTQSSGWFSSIHNGAPHQVLQIWKEINGLPLSILKR
jgi:hypothetical protein